MKKVIIKSLLAVFLFTLTMNVFGQEIVKYNYAEVIVLQKTDKNKSVFIQAYLNSTTDKSLNTANFKDIKSNADVFKFMNDKNWIFVERISAKPTNSVPLWISYVFKKKV